MKELRISHGIMSVELLHFVFEGTEEGDEAYKIIKETVYILWNNYMILTGKHYWLLSSGNGFTKNILSCKKLILQGFIFYSVSMRFYEIK